ncbi:DUF397 domain-containing protein [Solwaraspora sp. WMMA2056]|uniref:DUF397 domain-containing protein n=1 Tax=Solwaraspora sp. WMMA2056 TaxID=3015161 RepID=UPI00259B024A|nr:DUF397 domain-containing protein [Solwaraspora sp. WMMA2056]WJK41083.1 DUF397 domain-containing protein [Solwaraspora sp. WMMA2056]
MPSSRDALSPEVLATAQYRKSTRSDSTGSCVEVATNVPATVLVRDSKDPAGPALTFAPAGWTSFLSTLTDTP